MIHKTTQVADAVLAVVDQLLEAQTVKLNIWCEPYQNGREHGWSLRVGVDEQVAFSENRNTDRIVVYAGEPKNFNSAGNVPDQTAYTQKSYFLPGQYQEAAEFIVRVLIYGYAGSARDSALPIEPVKRGGIGWK